MEERIAAVTEAIEAVALPEDMTLLSCELGSCRTLLGLPYGRLADLPLVVRKTIAGMMGLYQLRCGSAGAYFETTACFMCAADLLVDQYDYPSCSVGRCASLARYRETRLDQMPRDIWLMVVAYAARPETIHLFEIDNLYRNRGRWPFELTPCSVCDLCSE